MMHSSVPLLTAHRLYSVSFRPHELALHGDRVAFTLRYGPVADDPAALVTTHYRLLVLEIHTEQALVKTAGTDRRLLLLKCGWEAELTTTAPCATTTLREDDQEVPFLLARVADTVNDLARRAGLEAPLGPDLVADLVTQYRSGLQGLL